MTVLVTGGSRGIGLACALHLAREGRRVVIAARRETGLQEAVSTAAKEGLTLIPVVLDVSDLYSVERVLGEICTTGLDVLVHAAGVSALSHYTDHNDPNLWQKVMRTNLDGAYYCARSVLQCMHQHEPVAPRRLVFISSVLGLKGMAMSHAYCAAKHGVNGMVKALAQDVAATQITVNSVCPGWVDTAMARQDFTAMAARYQIPEELLISEEIQSVPIQRWIQASEVAALVSYLCSEAAGAITGQCLEISGG